MASHYIAILPKSLKNPSAWSLLVSKYKDLRLQSLQMSPEAFSSTYDNEIKLPYERWEARLHNPNGYTIIAHQEAIPSRVLNGVSTESTAQPEGSRRELIPVTCTEDCPKSKDQHLCLSHSEWSGTNTLICEDHLNSEPLKCHIVGVFVHPDFRCCGIGTRLMESVMELAKRVAKDSGAPEVLVRLSVHVANTKAFDFYRGLGFREEDAAGLGENGSAKPVDMVRRIVLDTGV